MKHLAFSGDERVGAARFEERSLLPVPAACVVANAVRERLTSLVGKDVDLRLWPPAIPRREAWSAIFEGARLYVLRGANGDAALVLRPHDACALAALLYGETEALREVRALSPLELEITRRAVAAVAGALAPVCGDVRPDFASSDVDAVTYFELHVLEPMAFCIGVALAKEPDARATQPIPRNTLLHAVAETTAELPLQSLRAREAATLQPGDVLAAPSLEARLRANGKACAIGTLGVGGERYAICVLSRR